MTNPRKSPLVWLALLVAAGAIISNARAFSEGEVAALEGLRAINRNDGQRFVAVAHTKLIQKIRALMASRVETVAKRGISRTDLENYGITKAEDFSTLPADKVARIAIDHASDTESPALKEKMLTTKFSIIGSDEISKDTLLVSIRIEIPENGSTRTSTVDVVSKLDGKVWKYWEFPELAKGF